MSKKELEGGEASALPQQDSDRENDQKLRALALSELEGVIDGIYGMPFVPDREGVAEPFAYAKGHARGFKARCELVEQIDQLSGLLARAQKALAEASALPPHPICACGETLTQCTSCAVADWQAAHPECPQCCALGGPATLPSAGKDEESCALGTPVTLSPTGSSRSQRGDSSDQ